MISPMPYAWHYAECRGAITLPFTFVKKFYSAGPSETEERGCQCLHAILQIVVFFSHKINKLGPLSQNLLQL
jgi:hypothetical protein